MLCPTNIGRFGPKGDERQRSKNSLAIYSITSSASDGLPSFLPAGSLSAKAISTPIRRTRSDCCARAATGNARLGR
jgi:hypothetical protein